MDASHAKWLRSVLGLHTGYLVIVQYVVAEHLPLHCLYVHELQFFLLCDPADLGLFIRIFPNQVSVPECQDLLSPVFALLEARTQHYSQVPKQSSVYS